EEAHRAQLQGVTQTVMSAAPDEHLAAISVIEEEIFAELEPGRVSDKAAILADLFRSEEIYGHRRSSPRTKSSRIWAQIRGRSDLQSEIRRKRVLCEVGFERQCGGIENELAQTWFGAASD